LQWSSILIGYDIKILRAGFYWPTLFNDVFSKVRSCEECQKFEGKQKFQSLPLKYVVVVTSFQQWGLEFIEEINPHSSGQHRYILMTNDYFTKWIEAIPTINATDKVIISFVLDNIFSRFACPRKLVTNNAQAFKYKVMVDFCKRYNIILTYSTPYYPQENGLEESSNTSLARIIKNLLAQNQRSWDSKLKFLVWEDTFQLVYGTYAVVSLQLGIPMMKLLQEEGEEKINLQRRNFQLIHLTEERERVNQKALDFKDKMKLTWF